MKLTKKDIAMYALFFAALALFVFLFFIFFRNGDFQVSEYAVDIPKEVTSVNITANYTNVSIFSSESDKAYIEYGRRITAGSEDEISVTVLDNSMQMTIKRKQGNTLSGMWRSSAPVSVYLPEDNNITLKVKCDTGSVKMEQVVLHRLDLQTKVSVLNIKSSVLDRLNYKSSAGKLTADAAKIAVADLNVNAGSFDFLHQTENDGFTLDSTVGAGLILSDDSMELSHPKVCLKYADKIAGLQGANKIVLNSNVAIIRITE